MENNQQKGSCEKKGEDSPDCSSCDQFAIEDISEEMAAASGGGDFSSLCFRVFHRDAQTRGQWRRKACKHFRES